MYISTPLDLRGLFGCCILKEGAPHFWDQDSTPSQLYWRWEIFWNPECHQLGDKLPKQGSFVELFPSANDWAYGLTTQFHQNFHILIIFGCISILNKDLKGCGRALVWVPDWLDSGSRNLTRYADIGQDDDFWCKKGKIIIFLLCVFSHFLSSIYCKTLDMDWLFPDVSVRVHLTRSNVPHFSYPHIQISISGLLLVVPASSKCD